MTDETFDFILALEFLSLVPLVLWLLSAIFADSLKRLKWPTIWIHPAVYSLSLAYAYLFTDSFVSLAICLSLYHLTRIGATALSPSALLVRWGGLGLLLAYCTLDFPIKPIIKLLWPILERWHGRPDWIEKLDGISHSATSDLLLPWIEGMGDAAHWVGLCVFGGAVVPYLAVLTVTWMAKYLEATLRLTRVGKTMMGFLLSLSDWGGAFVILTLMLNLLVLSFPRLAIGEILHR